MAKHRKYSRKRRGQRKNKMRSRKMRGGFDNDNDYSQGSFHLSELNENSQGTNYDDFSLGDDDISTIDGDENHDLDLSYQDDGFRDSMDDGDTTFEEDTLDLDDSSIGSMSSMGSSINSTNSSFGGKRRRRRRRTNKRKSKKRKSKKSRKTCKRRQHGGLII